MDIQSVRKYMLQWILDYSLENDIKLSLLETIKISEALSTFIETGINDEVEEKFRAIDKHIQSKTKKINSGSLTLK